MTFNLYLAYMEPDISFIAFLENLKTLFKIFFDAWIVVIRVMTLYCLVDGYCRL